MNLQAEVNNAPVSEEQVDTGSVAQEQPQRQVPLEALEAERRKRQDLERQNTVLQEYALRYQQMQEQANKPKEEVDGEDLVNEKRLTQFHEKLTKNEMAQLKRDIAEETFKEVNPEALKQINMHLKEILERKPWLVQSIESAPNRYSRAYEIVQDFAPQQVAKPTAVPEAKKIVENAKKPGSPVAAGKSANLNNVEYLRSIAGTKEFREYRTNMRQGK